MPLVWRRENRRDLGESGVPDTTWKWPPHPAAPGPRLSYNTKPGNPHGSFREAKPLRGEAVDERRSRVIHEVTRRTTKGHEGVGGKSKGVGRESVREKRISKSVGIIDIDAGCRTASPPPHQPSPFGAALRRRDCPPPHQPSPAARLLRLPLKGGVILEACI